MRRKRSRRDRSEAQEDGDRNKSGGHGIGLIEASSRASTHRDSATILEVGPTTDVQRVWAASGYARPGRLLWMRSEAQSGNLHGDLARPAALSSAARVQPHVKQLQ
jgi:hypothetical protein